jgi:hypothetical protein
MPTHRFISFSREWWMNSRAFKKFGVDNEKGSQINIL